MDQNECEICRDRELRQLREDLNKCKKSNATKDKKMKVLNKRVFICTIIGVAIAAIFGKEALDALTEWMGSIRGFNSATLGDLVFPSPGALGLFVIAGFTRRSRKRPK